MSGGLKMPGKGKAALLLSELNAEHAPKPEEGPMVTEPETNEATNVTTLQRSNEGVNSVTTEGSNEGTLQDTLQDTLQETNEPAPGGTNKRTKAARETGRPTAESERESRLARAREIAAADEIAVVTVRVSAKLNKYLDDYVDRVNRIEPKRRYRKQDAIAEAFAAFYADHVMPPAPMDDEL